MLGFSLLGVFSSLVSVLYVSGPGVVKVERWVVGVFWISLVSLYFFFPLSFSWLPLFLGVIFFLESLFVNSLDSSTKVVAAIYLLG